jgi:hypothetical protein
MIEPTKAAIITMMPSVHVWKHGDVDLIGEAHLINLSMTAH